MERNFQLNPRKTLENLEGFILIFSLFSFFFLKSANLTAQRLQELEKRFEKFNNLR